MLNFEFYNPTKIIFGKDSHKKLPSLIKPFGNKVLLTYGKSSIKQNGIYSKILSELKDFEVREFGGIESNPRIETIRNAINENRSFKPDFILAIGGGSVIDATKLISSALHYESDPWDFLIKGDVEPKKYVPFGVVLTISATGSEMNNGAVITNWTTHQKLYFDREQTYPKFSILDPINTFTVPKDQTAYGIIDAFSHILEQYIHTSKDTPLQDRFSESVLLTLIENSQIVLNEPDNYVARANIMLSACMALNNLTGSGVAQDWATHKIEHELSAFYDIPHAAGLAIITPRWMRMVRKQKESKLAHYGKRIWNLSGNDEDVSKETITKTAEFFKSLGVKMNLIDWNISDEHFDEIIERLTKSPIGEFALTKEQIKQILNNCL